MPPVFIDTAAHIGLVDATDRLHARARALFLDLTSRRVPLVTTEAVLIEFLTFVSSWGPTSRHGAIDYVARLRRSLRIVPQSSDLFDRALDLYARRPDKSYSMVDCISMVVCRDLDITGVLTADRDFEQEGFTALLR